MMEDGLQFTFNLPQSALNLPNINLRFESAEECPGGTVQITKIRLYGDSTDNTQ